MPYEVEVKKIDNRVQVSLVDNERKIVSIGSGRTTGKAFEEALELIESDK
jgi:prefoldin subunit 5